jgi:hypothetical protein
MLIGSATLVILTERVGPEAHAKGMKNVFYSFFCPFLNRSVIPTVA